jgi:AcrR family transcriptional regulator
MDQKRSASPVLWDRLDRRRRGPQASLTYEHIARAAIDIADVEGIEGVSMRKVAARLGSGTMSLYRYVSTKEELIDLMVDDVCGELIPPTEPSGDWRRELLAAARRSRSVALRHPWVIAFLLARPALGPNALRLTERAMASVDGLGLDIDAMLDMTSTIQAFVIGVVQAELAEQEARRRTGLAEAEWRMMRAPYLQRVLETGDRSYLHRIIAEAEDFPDRDEVFERRLHIVIEGLARYLERRALGTSHRGEM